MSAPRQGHGRHRMIFSGCPIVRSRIHWTSTQILKQARQTAAQQRPIADLPSRRNLGQRSRWRTPGLHTADHTRKAECTSLCRDWPQVPCVPFSATGPRTMSRQYDQKSCVDRARCAEAGRLHMRPAPAAESRPGFSARCRRQRGPGNPNSAKSQIELLCMTRNLPLSA